MSPEVYVRFWLKPGDPPVELSIGDEGQEEMIPKALTYITRACRRRLTAYAPLRLPAAPEAWALSLLLLPQVV
jgi:hypothetical protein